CYQYYSGYIF
nr:immunoglobulin light chain junction region [Macaca mulatta]MOW40046.1 immunoglobulin light chain junction region [Macaca mulatta]MOW40145.1 immunoglobulin light chain junction region [Macaca mulatta]MOX48806.1 immunoglobulin light chain junction region [Macaca mulatta]